MKLPRPQALPGITYKMPTHCGKIYITITTDADGNPFEIFVRFGNRHKRASAKTAKASAYATPPLYGPACDGADITTALQLRPIKSLNTLMFGVVEESKFLAISSAAMNAEIQERASEIVPPHYWLHRYKVAAALGPITTYLNADAGQGWVSATDQFGKLDHNLNQAYRTCSIGSQPLRWQKAISIPFPL